MLCPALGRSGDEREVLSLGTASPQGSSKELTRPGPSLACAAFQRLCLGILFCIQLGGAVSLGCGMLTDAQDGQRRGRAAPRSKTRRCCQSPEIDTARPISLAFPQHVRKSCLLTFELRGGLTFLGWFEGSKRGECNGLVFRASGCQSSLLEASSPSLQVQM